MQRYDIIKTISETALAQNIENGEFSYAKVIDRKLKGHFKLDIRFYDAETNTAVLVETKQHFVKKDKEQLFSYVELEQEWSPNRKIIAILANTEDNEIKVWKIIGESVEDLNDKKLKSLNEYVNYFIPKNINDKTAVLENTSNLNRQLHDNGISEKLRSQFVGTCLLALKNGLVYKKLSTRQIIAGIKEILGGLLNDSIDKACKLVVLETVLEDQNVESIDNENFHKLLKYIEEKILPYINEYSNEGQDILSYFFTTFNKYVSRDDKNQAFTPNHISDFMCKVAGITRKSKVLDPTCGSGTFLVQAMTQALRCCDTDEERNNVKKNNIYGIEFDKNVYGLSTTNMLIHGDGNSNIICCSCFDKAKWIEGADIDIVLMNPPYNAAKKQVPKEFGDKYGKSTTDPSKGLYFVKFVAEHVKRGKLLTLLPMACSISNKGIIQQIKRELLDNHTLDAVFSFPSEMFYPGASAVACCMVFDLGKPHPDGYETFFGYFKDDGFEKRKGVGRIDTRNKWKSIEADWLDLYKHRTSKPGISICKCIDAEVEWCAEAYMETDYSKVTDKLFINTLREYASFMVRNSNPEKIVNYTSKPLAQEKLNIDSNSWKWFNYDKDIFTISGSQTTPKTELEDIGEGEYPYVTTQAVNNGIEGFYDCYTEEAGVLTVDSAVLGFCAYQDTPFSASDHVEKLTPKHKLSIYTALFLTTIINMEQYRYNYGRKCSQTKLKNAKIMLPATSKGEPDYKWMEDYIKGLPYSQFLSNANVCQVSEFQKTELAQLDDENSDILIYDTSDVPASDRFTRFLPLYSIKAACGPHEFNFSDEGLDNDLGWIDASKFGHRLNKNMFVIQAVGHSMEPRINDGDYCVFEWYTSENAGSREGEIVLAKDVTEYDDDYSGRFTIKKYHRVSESVVELRSINVGHPTFILEQNGEFENLRPVLAVFIDTL